jgi:hypothetical protein
VAPETVRGALMRLLVPLDLAPLGTAQLACPVLPTPNWQRRHAEQLTNRLQQQRPGKVTQLSNLVSRSQPSAPVRARGVDRTNPAPIC